MLIERRDSGGGEVVRDIGMATGGHVRCQTRVGGRVAEMTFELLRFESARSQRRRGDNIRITNDDEERGSTRVWEGGKIRCIGGIAHSILAPPLNSGIVSLLSLQPCPKNAHPLA